MCITAASGLTESSTRLARFRVVGVNTFSVEYVFDVDAETEFEASESANETLSGLGPHDGDLMLAESELIDIEELDD